jgi:hypothetical protein
LGLWSGFLVMILLCDHACTLYEYENEHEYECALVSCELSTDIAEHSEVAVEVPPL